MDQEAALLAAIPDDPLAAFALADFLEERSDPRGELLRLVYTLTRTADVPDRARLEARLRSLLEQGVEPIGPYLDLPLSKTVSMTFAWVPPGTSWLGSPPDDPGRSQYETHPHRAATLTKGFFLGAVPVTQSQWRSVFRSSPSTFKGPKRPVETVAYENCQELCRRLSARLGRTIRLPTETEWEHACRAGTTTAYHGGNDLEALKRVGWCSYNGVRNSARHTRPVGELGPNGWGLRDMHGNVHEWCILEDPDEPVTESGGGRFAVRGGCWYNEPVHCRAAFRYRQGENHREQGIGCRVLLEAD
jgi:formylglycine-generating enzyme required for sulfatase activity